MDFADNISPDDVQAWVQVINEGADVTTGGENNSVGIDELLGHALGCIGLSFDDFCGLTIGEFEAVCKAWHDQQERVVQDEWERMRLLAAITIQPHVKKKITARQLLPFPWEKGTKKAEAPKVSAEEAKRRFERLVESQR